MIFYIKKYIFILNMYLGMLINTSGRVPGRSQLAHMTRLIWISLMNLHQFLIEY